MTQRVTDENGIVHTFPDDATPDEMEAALNFAPGEVRGPASLRNRPPSGGITESGKNVGREMLSQMGGALAGGLSIEIPVIGPYIAPAVSAGSYQLLNRAMGGSPTLADTALAATGPIGGMARAGTFGKAVQSIPRAAALQVGTTMGVQEAEELAGALPQTSLPAKAANALMIYGGERLAPTGAPRNIEGGDQALIAAKAKLGMENIPSAETAGQYAATGRDTWFGARGQVTDWAKRTGEQLLDRLGVDKVYAAQPSADVMSDIRSLLGEMLGGENEAAFQKIQEVVANASPSDAQRIVDTLRQTVAKQPMKKFASSKEVAPLLRRLGGSENITPESLGKTLDDILGASIPGEFEKAKAAYVPVFETLTSSPIKVAPEKVQAAMRGMDEQFQHFVESGKRFYTPATSDAEALAKTTALPENQIIVDPQMRPIGRTTKGPDVTLGDIGGAIRDVNMNIGKLGGVDSIPWNNRPKLAANLELKSRLEMLGNQMVEELKQKLPQMGEAEAAQAQEAIQSWSDYAKVRAQYGSAAERAKLYAKLPEGTALGLAAARGRGPAKANPVLDILDQLLPQKAYAGEAKAADIYQKTWEAAKNEQFTPRDLKNLKKSMQLSAKDAALIDEEAAKLFPAAQAAEKPPAQDYKALLDKLLPATGEDLLTAGALVGKAVDPSRKAAWDFVQKNPQISQDISGAVARRAIDSSKTEGRFDIEKFRQFADANLKAGMPQAEFDKLMEIGALAQESVQSLAQQPTKLLRTIKLFDEAGKMEDVASKFLNEAKFDPDTATYLIQTLEQHDRQIADIIAKTPPGVTADVGKPVLKRFQDNLKNALVNPQGDFGNNQKLLMFLDKWQRLNPETLRTLLGNDSFETLNAAATILDRTRALFNIAGQVEHGVNIGSMKGEVRQTLSAGDAVKSAFTSLGALVAGSKFGAAATGATMIPILAAVVTTPKLLAAAALNPSSKWAKAVQYGGRALGQAMKTGAVTGVSGFGTQVVPPNAPRSTSTMQEPTGDMRRER